MTKSQKIIGSISAVVMAGAMAIGFHLTAPAEDPNTVQINSITDNGIVRTFSNSDDNFNENLIIKTTTSTCSSWSECDVYFGVKNITALDMNPKIQFAPNNSGRMATVKVFNPQVQKTRRVDDYGLNTVSCTEAWVQATNLMAATSSIYNCKNNAGKQNITCNSFSPDRLNCIQNNVINGNHQETYFVDQWDGIVGDSVPDGTLDLTAVKQFKKDFKASDQYTFSIPAGQTKYFKAHIKFPHNTTGEYYIAAYDTLNGGFGELDPSWFSNSWSYRMSLTIDHTKVGATSTIINFPVDVATTSPLLKTVANGGHMGRSDGLDTVFTLSDGVTTINYEMEFYASTTGQTIAWVNVPSLSSSTDTTLYMYYGNASASDQSNKTAVWDANYKGVYHVPNGTTLSLNDSTSNANNASLYNNGTGTSTPTTGFIDGGVHNTSTVLSGVMIPSMNSGATSTFEAWALPTAADTSGGFARILENFFSDGIFLGAANTQFSFIVASDFSVSGGLVSPGTWSQVVGVYDGTTSRLYVNGILVASHVTTGPTRGSSVFGFGYDAVSPGNSAETWDGALDEGRISTTARSASWILTEYNNQSSPGTFILWGAEENVPLTNSPSAALNIDISSLNVNSSLNIGN